MDKFSEMLPELDELTEKRRAWLQQKERREREEVKTLIVGIAARMRRAARDGQNGIVFYINDELFEGHEDYKDTDSVRIVLKIVEQKYGVKTQKPHISKGPLSRHKPVWSRNAPLFGVSW